MRFTALIVAILTLLLAYGCGEDPNIETDQKSAIVRYLDSKKFNYTVQGGAYKYIANADRADRDKSIMVEKGDSVWIYFEAYTFTSDPGDLFFTNKKAVIAANPKLNSKFWSTDPLKVKVGSTDLIKGLSNALPFCRQADSVQIFIPSGLAYGDKPMALIEKNTPLLYIINIEKIKK